MSFEQYSTMRGGVGQECVSMVNEDSGWEAADIEMTYDDVGVAALR